MHLHSLHVHNRSPLLFLQRRSSVLARQLLLWSTLGGGGDVQQTRNLFAVVINEMPHIKTWSRNKHRHFVKKTGKRKRTCFLTFCYFSIKVGARRQIHQAGHVHRNNLTGWQTPFPWKFVNSASCPTLMLLPETDGCRNWPQAKF